MRLLLALLLGSLSLVPAAAAQQAPLTLRQSIAAAQQRSPQARIAQLDYEQARAQYSAYQSGLLPGFSLTGSAPGLSRALEEIPQNDGSTLYVQSSRLFSSSRLAVTQPLPWTGGRLFASTRLGRIDFFGDTDAFARDQWQADPVVIGLEQPLFQFNAMKWQRRTEPLRYEVAARSLKEDMEQVALETTSRFFDVYIAQINVETATFNVAVNDTVYTLSKGRFDIGKIAENDLLQSELALLNAQNRLSEQQIAYERALQALKTALGLDPAYELAIAPPTTIPEVEVTPAAALDEARRRRADFVALELDEVEAEREVRRARRATGFSASLTASYGLNQSDPALGTVYREPLDQQRVNVGFEIPLFHWGQGRAELEAARAARQRTAEQTDLRRLELEQEVYFEALQLHQLREQVRLAAKADTVASRRFEVARNRYRIGKIDITHLFDAQREKDSARQSYVQSLRQYWTSYYRLRRLTLYDFAADRPLPRP